jgi:GAF domain-containing protein
MPRCWPYALPLLRQGECIGVLGMARHRAGAFSDSEIALAESFRDQAVIAIQNAQLFNDTQEALERQTATTEVLQVINASPGDLDPVFDAIARKAIQLCGADMGGLWLVEGELAIGRGAYNMPEAYLPYVMNQSVPVKHLYGSVKGGPPFVHIPDIRERRAYRNRVPLAVADVEVQGIRTTLVVPLLDGDTLVGLFALNRLEVRPFTDKQIAMVQGFAAQAQIAMKNARLMNETREALERQTATADILAVISESPTDVGPVFQAIAERARVLCKADIGATTRLEGGMVHLAGVRGETPQAEEAMRSVFPMPLDDTSPNIRRAVLERGPVQIADVRQEPDYARAEDAQDKMGFLSIMSVPLLHDGRAIGTIGVARR